jgi:hypothetical protein
MVRRPVMPSSVAAASSVAVDVVSSVAAVACVAAFVVEAVVVVVVRRRLVVAAALAVVLAVRRRAALRLTEVDRASPCRESLALAATHTPAADSKPKSMQAPPNNEHKRTEFCRQARVDTRRRCEPGALGQDPARSAFSCWQSYSTVEPALNPRESEKSVHAQNSNRFKRATATGTTNILLQNDRC